MTDQKESNKEQKSDYINADKDFTPTKREDYGFFFFPDRFGKIHQMEWYKRFFTITGSREVLRKGQCERSVKDCLENHPGVKLLVSALKTSGCEPDLLRHFSCEYCDPAVKGGFDPTTNQTIVCFNSVHVYSQENVAKAMMKSLIQSFDYCRGNYNMFDLRHLACTQVILCHNSVYEYQDYAEIMLHELVHAYDHCRANIDYLNSYHVACTEVRAANLTSCSIWSAFSNDSITFRFRNTRKECVRRKAALSLQMVRNISELTAYQIVDSVIDKCINDTEPFGRRIRNSKDYQRAYLERFKFGYP